MNDDPAVTTRGCVSVGSEMLLLDSMFPAVGRNKQTTRHRGETQRSDMRLDSNMFPGCLEEFEPTGVDTSFQNNKNQSRSPKADCVMQHLVLVEDLFLIS